MSTALNALVAYMEPPTVPDDTKQCAAFPCALPADGACHACGDPVCADHSADCDVCFTQHCHKCLEAIEDARVCKRDKARFLEEIAAQKEMDRAELVNDLRRCKAKLSGADPAEQKLGFAGSMVERWIERLSA